MTKLDTIPYVASAKKRDHTKNCGRK